LSLSSRILVGLAAGIIIGLFFGEGAAALQPIADIYIRLMQMTVLPYLVVSLMLGLGQLSASQAVRLAKSAGLLLAIFCALTLVVVGLMPFTFPHYQDAVFFAQSAIEPRQSFGFADLFFTPNPFHALANAVVPAVVLFSSAIGIALITVPDKSRVLGLLHVLNDAIARVTQFVVGLTPVGVLAIAAVASGTLGADTFVRLEVYFVAFAVASLLLAFAVLPLTVTAVTPFSYREVVGIAKEALLTAFITNSVFIVLPMLVERSRELMQRHGLLNDEGASSAEVVVPILFNFPNAGRLLTLLFLPYAAWSVGAPLHLLDYPRLFFVGLFSYFAKAQVALPFLMDLLAVPHDLFQLYIPTTIVTGKFDSLVSAINPLVFALLGAGATTGFLVLDGRRIARAIVLVVAWSAAAIVGTSLLLGRVIDTTYRKDQVLKGMHLLRDPLPAVVHTKPPPPAPGMSAVPALERILARGTLRVGFVPDAIPYTFVNARGELVGFDVELAGALARDLGLAKLEFVPTDLVQMLAMLANGSIDVVMTVPYAVYWLRDVHFSAPHTEGVYGFAVRDERRHDFVTLDAIRAQKRLTIGIPVAADYMQERILRYLGPTDAKFVALLSPRDFFEGRRPELDALFLRAEVGSAWSLLHPEYSVIIPQPVLFRAPAGVAVSRAYALDLANFIDDWLVIQRASGTVQRAYDYWALGRGAERKEPRWSILHNLLGVGK
jgi:Na+/H+-dicarboxylate symporter/ABC-type amino acid transport substrate-binding protein